MVPTITCCPARSSGAPPDSQFPEPAGSDFRPADGTLFDPDGPGPAPRDADAPNYNPSNNPNSLVFDSSLRTISNLLVDQTLGNPCGNPDRAAARGFGKSAWPISAVTAIYQTFKPASDAEYQARVVDAERQDRRRRARRRRSRTPPTPEEQAALDAAAAAAQLPIADAP